MKNILSTLAIVIVFVSTLAAQESCNKTSVGLTTGTTIYGTFHSIYFQNNLTGKSFVRVSTGIEEGNVSSVKYFAFYTDAVVGLSLPITKSGFNFNLFAGATPLLENYSASKELNNEQLRNDEERVSPFIGGTVGVELEGRISEKVSLFVIGKDTYFVDKKLNNNRVYTGGGLRFKL